MAYQLVTATTDLSTKTRYLRSWSLAENAGSPAAARVLFRNGTSGGDIVIDVRLAASESKTQSYSVPVHFPLGIYVDVSAGTVRGSVSGT